jgi:hypothetical protein
LQRLDGELQSFRQFYENQNDRPSVAVSQRRYEEYKIEYDKHNTRSFFKAHKDVSTFNKVSVLCSLGRVVFGKVPSIEDTRKTQT